MDMVKAEEKPNDDVEYELVGVFGLVFDDLTYLSEPGVTYHDCTFRNGVVLAADDVHLHRCKIYAGEGTVCVRVYGSHCSLTSTYISGGGRAAAIWSYSNPRKHPIDAT